MSGHGLPRFVLEALADEPAAVEERALAEALAQLGVAAAAPRTPSAAARARLLGAVAAAAERDAPLVPRLGGLFDLDAAAMRGVLAALTDASRWSDAPIPGVSLFHFRGGPRCATADCGFVRYAPGVVFPEHRHLGRESALFLEGSYRDSSGRVFSAGDLQVMDADTRHGFEVLGEGALLVALCLEGGVEIGGQRLSVKSSDGA